MQTRVTFAFSLLLSLIALGGCTSLELQNTQVNLPGGGRYTLLPPDTLGRALVATQRIQGRFKEREFVLLAQLEIDQQRLAMVGLTASGNTLFSLLFQQGRINVERSPWLPDKLQPAYMLADLQMAFWPLDKLEPLLGSEGVKIRESGVQDNRIRRLLRDDQTLIEITYSHGRDPWLGRVTFVNKQWEYSYTIETVQVETL